MGYDNDGSNVHHRRVDTLCRAFTQDVGQQHGEVNAHDGYEVQQTILEHELQQRDRHALPMDGDCSSESKDEDVGVEGRCSDPNHDGRVTNFWVPSENAITSKGRRKRNSDKERIRVHLQSQAASINPDEGC